MNAFSDLATSSQGQNAFSDLIAQTPSDVTSAQNNAGSQAYDDYCQKFVEQMTTGHSGIFPSASAAINHYQQEGKLVTNPIGMKPGNLIYFSPDQSNKGFGHVGILTKDNRFISATEKGVEEMPISQWQQLTGQKVAGFVNPKSLPDIGN